MPKAGLCNQTRASIFIDQKFISLYAGTVVHILFTIKGLSQKIWNPCRERNYLSLRCDTVTLCTANTFPLVMTHSLWILRLLWVLRINYTGQIARIHNKKFVKKIAHQCHRCGLFRKWVSLSLNRYTRKLHHHDKNLLYFRC